MVRILHVQYDTHSYYLSLCLTMARGRHNKRGGGSRFAAQSAEEIEQRNTRLAELDEARAKRRQEEEEEAEEQQGDQGVSKDDVTLEKTAEEVGERVAAVTTQTETRKEREERQKEEARAAYRKMHEAGLTEEYKKDMEKLAEVRKRREMAAQKAKMEQEAAQALEEDRKQKAAAANAETEDDDDDDDHQSDTKKNKKKQSIPKLDKIAIKKMKPALLKEALKERGLDIQGNAKALTDRLLKYEAER